MSAKDTPGLTQTPETVSSYDDLTSGESVSTDEGSTPGPAPAPRPAPATSGNAAAAATDEAEWSLSPSDDGSTSNNDATPAPPPHNYVLGEPYETGGKECIRREAEVILDSTNMPETTRKHVVVLQCDLKGKLPGLPGHNVKIFTEDAGTKVKVNNKVQLMFVRGAASDGEYRVYWRLLK